MKFGIMAPYQLGPLEDGEYATRFGQLAEELGFESVWAVDHVVMCPDYQSLYPYARNGRSPFDEDVIQPDPLIWLTWVAAATQRLRLATGILILPQRNPVVLAKSLASLDRMSRGRMMLGVGVGWVKEEADALGTDFATRGERCDEYIEAMRALWRQPLSTYRGNHVGFESVVSRPTPVQEGGVPIIIGGHSPAAARRAGRLGDGFYPLGVAGEKLDLLLEQMRTHARDAGRDPDRIEVTCVGNLDLAVTRAYAEQRVNRVLISPPTGDLSALRESLSRFRDDVMLKLEGDCA